MTKKRFLVSFNIKYGLIRFIIVGICMLSINQMAYATPTPYSSHINVLMLYSWHKDMPWQKAIETGFKRKLAAKNISLDIFSEYIDAGRFPMDRIRGAIYELIKKKYVDSRIDLIISEGFAAANMIGQVADLFPNANKLVINSLMDKNQLRKAGLWEIKIKQDLSTAIQTMINVYDPEHIAVIADVYGTAGKQRLTNFKSAMKKVGTSLPVIYLTDPSLDGILLRTKNLPEKTAIFYLVYFNKGGERPLTPYKAVQEIAMTANAPIFTHWETLMGSGVIGGHLLSGEKVGTKAADFLISAIENRPWEGAENFQSNETDIFQHQYDWRQLQRWHIDKKHLPENSRILFYSPGLYESFPVEITVLLSFSVILIVLALTLIVQNRRRKNLQLHLRTIIETIPDLVWLKDRGGKYLSCNLRFERFFGAPEKDIIGKTDHDFVEKELADFFREKDEAVIATGKSTINEEEIIYADDGHRELLETIKTPMYDSRGNITGVLGIARDITERKKTETELRTSEEKFSKAFNNAPLLMTISDLKDGRYLNVNEVFSHTTGYTKDMAIGSTSIELGFISENDRERLINGLTSNGYIHELELTKADGSRMYCLYSGEIITIAGEQRLLSLALDITDNKIIGDRLQQAQKMESIGNLAGGIAHDFNNILFPVVGMSELLLEDLPLGSVERENAEEIFKAGKRGSALVKQILAFSRQSEHQMTPTRVQKVLKEVLNLARSTIPSDIEIKQDIQTDCGLIMADSTQIHQVAMNLVTNAYHAVETNGGKISVSLKEKSLQTSAFSNSNIEPGRYAILSISDTGKGIPPEILDKIFDPYFTTKEQDKGTGLGLAVVHGIVKAHGGEIKVNTEIGKGTTFNVYIPLMDKTDTHETIEGSADHPGGNERILLVDDEVSIAKLEQQMLERLGYQVTVRNSSPDALQTLRFNVGSFDLVITDMTMPNMTGDILAKEMIALRPDLPIIICTGFSERINQEKAEAYGIKGFLMKPVIKSDLAQMVRKVLDESKNI